MTIRTLILFYNFAWGSYISTSPWRTNPSDTAQNNNLRFSLVLAQGCRQDIGQPATAEVVHAATACMSCHPERESSNAYYSQSGAGAWFSFKGWRHHVSAKGRLRGSVWRSADLNKGPSRIRLRGERWPRCWSYPEGPHHQHHHHHHPHYSCCVGPRLARCPPAGTWVTWRDVTLQEKGRRINRHGNVGSLGCYVV